MQIADTYCTLDPLEYLTESSQLVMGSASDIATVLNSMPRKVRTGAGPSTLSAASGTASSLQVDTMVLRAATHSSELGWPSSKKSLR